MTLLNMLAPRGFLFAFAVLALEPAVRAAPPVPTVLVYAPGASGDTPPNGVIMGPRTLLATPMSVTLARDTLYVLSCQGRVTAYATSLDGDVVPSRVLGTLKGAFAYGVAVDPEGEVFISINWAGHGGHGFILVYPTGVTNDTIPARTIRGFHYALNGLARGPQGLLYRGSEEEGFEVINPRVPGERPPIRRLQGSNSELVRPGSFAVDTAGFIFVPNRDDAVRVYQGNTADNLRPIRTIQGRHTGLDRPVAVAVGPGDTLYVLNTGSLRGPSITVYAPESGGDSAPVRALHGESTGLKTPVALAVDDQGRLYVVSNPHGTAACGALLSW